MKAIKCYCKKCQRETTHIKKSDMTNAETVFLSLLTIGVAAAARKFWLECTGCGREIDL